MNSSSMDVSHNSSEKSLSIPENQNLQSPRKPENFGQWVQIINEKLKGLPTLEKLVRQIQASLEEKVPDSKDFDLNLERYRKLVNIQIAQMELIRKAIASDDIERLAHLLQVADIASKLKDASPETLNKYQSLLSEVETVAVAEEEEVPPESPQEQEERSVTGE